MNVRRDRFFPILLACFSLVSYALMYSLDLLFARAMGAEGYDDYSVALAAIAILSTVATLGVEKYALTAIPRFVDRADWPRLRGYFWFGARVTLTVAIVLPGLVLTLKWLIVHFVGGTFHPAAIVGVLFLPLIAVFLYLIEIGTALKYAISSMAIYRVLMPGCALLVGWLVTSSTQEMTAIRAVLAYLSGWGLALIAIAALLWRVFPRESDSAGAVYESRTWLRNAIPFVVYSLQMTVLVNSAVIVLEMLNVNEAQVALFAAAARTGSFVVLIATSTNRYYLPELATALEHGDVREIRRMEVRKRYLIGSMCGLFLLGIFVFGRRILGLFGPEFVAGYPALCILAVANSISTWFGAAPYYLKFTGHYRIVLTWTGCAVAVHLVLAIILAQQYGAIGSAIAYAVPMISLALAFRTRAVRTLDRMGKT